MKKSNKIALFCLGLLATLFVASSCTANFCSNKEKARLAYAFEPGVSTFYVDDTHGGDQVSGTNVWQVVEKTEDGKYANSSRLNSVISSVNTAGGYTATLEGYYKELDVRVLKTAASTAGVSLIDTNLTQETLNNVLKDYGYLKFYDAQNDSVWGAFDSRLIDLRNDLGWENAPSIDFVKIYKSQINQAVDQNRSCITTIPGEYGTYGDNKSTIFMDATTWGEAWEKGGHLIEGLVVYPVAWLLDSFANLFAGHDTAKYSTGIPQILSLLMVTIIVRLFIFLVTIKSTLSQQKMTALQPELAKIQQKYPNSNTNDSQKQRLAEEQMRLYKKNGVNPLSSLLVMIVQFPVFIGVWGAMTGSAVLSTGTFLNLDLSASIWECLKLGPANHAGWWTALVLILLMSAGQFFQMKVPQWLQKSRTKGVARLAKNPAEKSQNRTANIISYGMLIMIIFMGFTLPAAMGVYWFIGAIVSLIQTFIMHFVSSKKKSR